MVIFLPSKRGLFSLFYILGKLLIILGFFFLIPTGIAFFFKELNPFYDFLISFFICEIVGFLFLLAFPYSEELSYSYTFLLVALAWLVVPLFSSLPFWLSQHYASFLDAFFEAMSGFTTTGLTLIQDLDHTALSLNFWRHFVMFLGGQGIVIVVLSFFVQVSSYVLGLYFGEARQERIFPNVISTARFIWLVSLVYFFLGSSVLFIFLKNSGLPLQKAIFHSLNLFMAAFDTGGFTPQSLNISYYHSLSVEFLTLVIMILGSFNFSLHYFIWFRNRREIYRNIETRTFFISFSLIFILLNLVTVTFFKGGWIELFRKTFYQLVSAHTGCGFSNVYVKELNSWPQSALVFIIIAMALGGGAGSTTGGIKLMRLALLFKTVGLEIRKWLLPPQARVYAKYHHLQEVVLDDKKVRFVFVITFFYLVSYFMGTIIGMLCGYGFLESLFESVSASANVGLSMGITSPQMPAILKLTYIIQMWSGRLEFISVIVGIAMLLALFKKTP